MQGVCDRVSNLWAVSHTDHGGKARGGARIVAENVGHLRDSMRWLVAHDVG